MPLRWQSLWLGTGPTSWSRTYPGVLSAPSVSGEGSVLSRSPEAPRSAQRGVAVSDFSQTSARGRRCPPFETAMGSSRDSTPPLHCDGPPIGTGTGLPGVFMVFGFLTDSVPECPLRTDRDSDRTPERLQDDGSYRSGNSAVQREARRLSLRDPRKATIASTCWSSSFLPSWSHAISRTAEDSVSCFPSWK